MPDLVLEKPTPAVLIEPRSFARANYRVRLPEHLKNRLILEFPGTPAAPLVLEAPVTQSSPLAGAAVPKESVSRPGDSQPALSAERYGDREPSGEGPDYLDKLVGAVPLKRKGSPRDVAGAVAFLLDSEYITGQCIFVDGGESIK